MVLLLYVSLSLQNEPSKNPTSVFYPDNGLWIIVGFAVALVGALLARLFLRVGGEFFKTKRKLWTGFAFFGVALLLSGLGVGSTFSVRNFRYIGMLFLSLFALYYILLPLIDWKSLPKDYFAWSGLFLGLTVSLELVNIYMTNSVWLEGGAWLYKGIIRWRIFTGWGVYNNIGCMLLFCMPCAFYFSITQKNGWIYNLLAHLLLLAIIFTNSRNSILVGGILYVVCMVLVLKSRKNYKENFAIFVVCITIALAGILLFYREIEKLFSTLFQAGLNSEGRLVLFKTALKEFLYAPVFGQGFFGGTGAAGVTVGKIEMMPQLCHNTLLEMLSSCGAIGLLAYAYHRLQTVKLFYNRPTREKTFVGLCIASLLLSCILDCHFFLIGPGFSYSIFLAIAERANELQGEPPLLERSSAKRMRY
jgi:hypothetical protein